MLYWLFKIVLFPLFKIYHRAEREGLENVPRKGPLIVVANHSSLLDPWYLGVMFRARHIHYMVAREWYKNWIYDFLLFLCGCFPVTTSDPTPSTLKKCLKILKRGKILGIFPEGRVRYDGKMQPFKLGAAQIASKTGVPVIPAAICGGYRAFPRGRRFPRPTKIKVVMGAPRYFQGRKGGTKPSKEALAREMMEIRDWIAKQVNDFSKRP